MTHSLYREQVGFMTYDNKINFYNCNKALAQPQQMTVGDVQVKKNIVVELWYCGSGSGSGSGSRKYVGYRKVFSTVFQQQNICTVQQSLAFSMFNVLLVTVFVGKK